MDKDTLQILIMVAGFAITIIIGLLRFPSRDEMNKRFDDVNQRITDMNQQFNERIADLNQQFNERITDLNQRFDDMNRRFDDMNKRFDDMNRYEKHLSHTHTGETRRIRERRLICCQIALYFIALDFSAKR
ncbi:YtxH domain-containing protein [Candidatus Poribacteria bacterium]|nr:YtxH domain-containing protein [Candidatus Poribacteria bacterium]